MKIETTLDEHAAMLSLEGVLDRGAADELRNAAAALGDHITDLVLDLKKLEGITSVGLNCVAMLNKSMRGRGSLTLIYVPDVVMEAFVTTGLAKRLNIIL